SFPRKRESRNTKFEPIDEERPGSPLSRGRTEKKRTACAGRTEKRAPLSRGDERNKFPPAPQHTAHSRASGNPGIQNSSPLMKNALDPRFRGDERRKEHRFRGGRAVDSI